MRISDWSSDVCSSDLARGDKTAVTRLRQRIGECMTADAVDDRGPPFFLQRLAGIRQLVAVDDLCGTERGQVFGFAGLAGRGDDIVTELGEQSDCDAATAADGAGAIGRAHV